MSGLDPALAERLAGAALGHVGREYPHVLVHAMTGPEAAVSPRERHPIFFGSYDWHSCVHAHWLLARLLRTCPQLAQAPAIRARFDAAFTPSAVEGERAYLARPASAGFERPYGWAWLLKLAAELHRRAAPEGRIWRARIEPLVQVIVARFEAFLPRADYPVRAGVHSNTAFALLLARDFAREEDHPALVGLIDAKALAWHGADADCQAWEPSGDDFLSPALVEAALMAEVLERQAFRVWFARFLPRAGEGAPASLFAPAAVSDRSDGKIAHLDGLNLSRAWCWRRIAGALAPGDPAGAAALVAADRHLAASLPHVTGDYMGEHWLASFALLALLAQGEPP